MLPPRNLFLLFISHKCGNSYAPISAESEGPCHLPCGWCPPWEPFLPAKDAALCVSTRQEILELYHRFSSRFIAVVLLQFEQKWENDQFFAKLYHPGPQALFVIRWLSQTCYFSFAHKSLSIRDRQSLGLNEKHDTLLAVPSSLLYSSGAQALKLSSSQQ